MMVPFSSPDITEEEIAEVVDTLRSGWITTGPKTKRLEQEIKHYTGAAGAVCLNSATAGLELVLRIFGIGPGDEVIIPAVTYTASCSVIEHVGAKPVMIDVQTDHFEMDYDALEQAITEKTKVIIPVELAGIPCDYDRIKAIVNRKAKLFRAKTFLQEIYHRPLILSDGAHAFGAKYKGVDISNVADFTVFSFQAVKNLTTAEGGVVTWKATNGVVSESIYKQFQIYSLNGQTRELPTKSQPSPWEYDIVLPGYKFNMTDIMASIGLVQLRRYEKLQRRRSEIVSRYNAAFEGSRIRVLDHFNNDYESSKHLYITHIQGIDQNQRDLIIQKMAEKGIACNVHYKPLPLFSAYSHKGFDMADFPNAAAYYSNTITLPLHTKLTDVQVDYVAAEFLNIVREVANH
ncbi:DegT/DnrJ/EryC1/StrS family aminotransferase [Streptococcus halotolerans]|uniref:DegT/DnrJ/EryC1/StrS family aminotransferase n=1 Tax=Streptococcus halotolerans TaxID=1814128 RepID=UPI001F47868D|nr:DegT/DnrJ/EryC1/StrS family aminotransferase [Streptococcus halotolerans]